MSEDEIWKQRYVYLESTIEQMMKNIADAFERLELRGEGTEFQCAIRKVVKTEGPDCRVYCVADGRNMEYKFEFFENSNRLTTSKFQRMNAWTVPSGKAGRPDRCRVTVRQSINGEATTLTKEIEL